MGKMLTSQEVSGEKEHLMWGKTLTQKTGANEMRWVLQSEFGAPH
jgi:hypothetical protein